MNIPENEPPTSRLTSRSEVEISEAIQGCARKCMENADPRNCAEAFTIALIADGWTAADAHEVRIGALRVLSTVTGDDALWPEQ
jgi:hypothetical protein